MNIIFHPYAQKLRNNERNPKNYPYFPELLKLLGGSVIQLGVPGEEALVPDFRTLPLKEIRKLIKESDLWLSGDSFLPHLAHHIPIPGAVLWSVSDPVIFGYKENLNLLKNRSYLRKNQFDIWENQSYNADAFLPAVEVAARIEEWLKYKRKTRLELIKPGIMN